MSTRMLVDARHPEETRVTVVKGSRVEDFDYESTTRRQLKGNIYLARVTRVEPSLQAAFIEYGGNRHGFLAFSEIHPDYYQIPVEDREALIEEETQVAAAEKAAEDAEEEETSKKRKPRRRRGRRSAAEKAAETDAVISEDADAEDSKAEETDDAQKSSKDAKTDDAADQADDSSTSDTSETEDQPLAASEEDASDEEALEEVDAEVKESDEEDKEAEIEAAAASRRRNLRALKRKYSIQEVIKRRQVLLIQVVKEERGNKGAALTTYLSLAGRYCVLMPNSTHSGGISRKISNVSDRKKLKQIIGSLNVSSDMGLIVRTAGINRTKTEIKRDYDYLLRLWNGIRDLTLKSTAPALIYEEGNLIKRTIRDVYTRDIDEIWVEGERGYRAAKDFMKLLMPSHAKKVQNYKDRIPLYHRYQVENQLEAMYQPIVQLKSGGYIVINPTEALISIDVNSGRATKEHNIEETAVKTNLEAAEEVARQLRLRDMAGLVVIDFIDMEERGNNRAVERRMKEVLKSDRARIQVGRISSFGLMEMSRQRLRPNLLEVAMETCPHCAGTGLVRSVESASIMALRLLEEEGIRNRSSIVRVSACPEVAIYLLNQKRSVLSDLEAEYGLSVQVLADSNLGPSDVEITREAGVDPKGPTPQPELVVKMDSATPITEEPEETAPASDREDQPRKKRRRRRRRRRGSGGDENESHQQQAQQAKSDEENSSEGHQEQTSEDDKPENASGRRRRGSRGGRRRRSREDNRSDAAETEVSPEEVANTEKEEDKSEKPVRRRRRVKKPADSEAAAKAEEKSATDATDEPQSDKEEKPKTRRRRTKTEDVPADTAEVTGEVSEDKPKPRRRRRKAEDSPTDGADVKATEAKDEKPTRRRTNAKKATETDTGEGDTKKPRRASARKAPSKAKAVKVKDAAESKPSEPAKTEAATVPTDPDQPKKKGWWQRTFG